MTSDRFEQDLRIVLREQLPGEAPLALRLRVAGITVEAVDARTAKASFRPRQLAWILLASAAIMAALAAGALLIASRPHDLPRHAESLVPTGVTVPTLGGGIYQLVADADGSLWMIHGGRLVRFDPTTETARAWTAAADAAFTGTERIFPARDGGVWLTGDQLRWFDGERFRDVIVAPEGMAPEEIHLLHEAPDGSLWLEGGSNEGDAGDLLHWDGSSWSRLEGPRPGDHIDVISVDAEARVWAGTLEGWIARHDGTSWTTAAVVGDPGSESGVLAIQPLPDGTARVVTYGGLGVFDGSTWTLTAPAPWDGARPQAAFGPDGDVWVAGGWWLRPPAHAYRFDGRGWVEYPGLEQGPATGVAATEDGVYVLVYSVLKELSGKRWEQAWTPGTATSPDAGTFTALLAISRHELWAATSDVVWHVADGAWTRDRSGFEGQVNGLALAPDGTLWVASAEGVAYRRDGIWATADATSATAVTVDRQGAPWVGSGSSVWQLRPDGPDWTRETLPESPLPSVTSLAVDSHGVVWAGGQGRLARYDGSGWMLVREVDGSLLDSARVVGTASDGQVRLEAWLDRVGRTPDDPWGPALASFDGLSWAVIEAPAGTCGLATGADGRVWASTQRGPAVRDGDGWSFPFSSPRLTCAEHIDSSSMDGVPQISVAADGTPFVNHTAGIWGFPAVATPSP